VLEHLYDPWSTLKSHAKLLKPTGVINASIPNVQHWSLLDHVMRGQWNYTDHGLLDDTHIRFFTLATMGRMFANAGLKVDSVFGVNIFAERGLQFCEAMRPALATLGIDFEEFRSKSLALQYVLTASPAA
jgi:predicted SAM-dependent methyltransferase